MKIEYGDVRIICGVEFRLETKERKHLQQSPEGALDITWKTRCGKANLSVFTMHYLTKSELPIQQYFDELRNGMHGCRILYCATTRLPIVGTLFVRSFLSPGFRLLAPITYLGFARHWSEESAIRTFNSLLPQYDKPGLTDEEVRVFGGHPIPKKKWKMLKDTAALYQPPPKIDWDPERRCWNE